jgi:hypothetical protein
MTMNTWQQSVIIKPHLALKTEGCVRNSRYAGRMLLYKACLVHCCYIIVLLCSSAVVHAANQNAIASV